MDGVNVVVSQETTTCLFSLSCLPLPPSWPSFLSWPSSGSLLLTVSLSLSLTSLCSPTVFSFIKSPLKPDKKSTPRLPRNGFATRVGMMTPEATPLRACNVNPFTPEVSRTSTAEIALQKTPTPVGTHKALFSALLFSPSSESKPPASGQKNPAQYQAANEADASHYAATFEEINKIGSGSFGEVFKCRHRLDGCLYAVKRSQRSVTGQRAKQEMYREAYAMAVIGGNHPNLLRYYTAWEEQDRLYIQSELCEGGSMELDPRNPRVMSEDQLVDFLKQVGQGLQHMHSKGFAHLDIKPENIYLTPNGLYKIGDLGLMVKAEGTTSPVEGDSRYLAPELLFEDLRSYNLRKADVFALGISVLELGNGKPLPKNGEEWQSLRNGHIPATNQMSTHLQCVILDMMHPDANKRPCMNDVLTNPLLDHHSMKVQRKNSNSPGELHAFWESQNRYDALQRQLKMSQEQTRTLLGLFMQHGIPVPPEFVKD